MSFGNLLSSLSIVVLAFSSGAFAATKAEDRIWITRPDGSLQCDEKSEDSAHDPVAEAKEQLKKKGIHILESKRRNDGRVHAQMCGISTGNEISFLIPKKEFSRAKTLGFEAVVNP